MKIAIWAYTLAVALASASVVGLCSQFRVIFQQQFHGRSLPYATEFLLRHCQWAWDVPLPWLVAAIWLSWRGNATPSRCLAFAGLATLAIVFIFFNMAVAFTLPFIPIITPLQ